MGLIKTNIQQVKIAFMEHAWDMHMGGTGHLLGMNGIIKVVKLWFEIEQECTHRMFGVHTLH